MLPHAVYWVGALADWYTTKRGLEYAGKGKELNVARWFMRVLGRDWGLSVLKLGVWVGFLWYGMPAGAYYLAGAIQFLAALGNHFGWWSVIYKRLKRGD